MYLCLHVSVSVLYDFVWHVFNAVSTILKPPVMGTGGFLYPITITRSSICLIITLHLGQDTPFNPVTLLISDVFVLVWENANLLAFYMRRLITIDV